MATTGNRADARGLRIGAWLMTMGMAFFPGLAAGKEKPSFELWEFGVMPRPSVLTVLIELEPVRRDLKLTDAQKTEQQAVLGRQLRDYRKKMEEARRDVKDPEKLQAATAAIALGFREAIRATYRPGQWERLDQIQLQAQGPLAFSSREQGPRAAISNVGPPLAERLGLSEDQVRFIDAIVERGMEEISKAASVVVPLDPTDRPTTDDIRAFVEGLEFSATREKATRAARAAWVAVIRRIGEALTASQRQEYRRLLGAPFDLLSLRRGLPAEQERQVEIKQVTQALGIAEGGDEQHNDPHFKTRVDLPAYAGAGRSPRVLFDEAHRNFHTVEGRYRPFAELIVGDGYRIIPNRDPFTREVLARGDILIIANAMAGEGDGVSAFTEAECEAVRDWVGEGGSLLLIADIPPWGSAAERLAGRFGVDMSKGVVADPANSEGGDVTHLVFSRENHLLGDHPIAAGRDDSERLTKVLTFTGTSLKGPEGSVPILALADTAIGFERGRGRFPARGRSQGLAMAFGRGRVVVMGEAGGLSAQVVGLDNRFGMNVPGIDNRQLALNILHWLSGLLEPREATLKRAG